MKTLQWMKWAFLSIFLAIAFFLSAFANGSSVVNDIDEPRIMANMIEAKTPAINDDTFLLLNSLGEAQTIPRSVAETEVINIKALAKQ